MSRFVRWERSDRPINGKKQKILAALLSTSTKEAAARVAGVSVKTINRCLQDDEFLTAYKHEAAGIMDRATRQLQQNLTAAIDRLGAIVADDEEASANQITAARTLLDYGLKFTEFNDVLEQVKTEEKWKEEIDDGNR